MSENILALFKKRYCWRPTLFGLVVILVLIVVIFRLSLPFVYNYLTVNESVESKTMILEGWMPTYALADAIEYYNDNNYDRLVVTGMPITNYEFISPYRYTAEATILALRHYGFYDTIYLANIPNNVYVDRTYHTAIASKMLFKENNWPKNFNIYSLGVHSRRSRMMFQKAFGRDYEIGIIAPRDRTFLPKSWWSSSKGFRNVSNEFVATAFVSLFFHPKEYESQSRILTGRYVDSIYYSRGEKYHEFTDSTTSRFSKEEIDSFKGFKYYDPDIKYRVQATFTIDTTSPEFGMKTSTDRVPIYRAYGYLDFILNDTSYRLTAYQNMAFKDHAEYGNYLFIPFKDLTNTITTYGAGRYIDIEIPDNEQVIIDFNLAYNPYCAYYDRWSCPLVPYENHLDAKIPAGEKKYK